MRQVWKASDDTIHETEDECEEHEKCIEVEDWFTKNFTTISIVKSVIAERLVREWNISPKEGWKYGKTENN